MSFCPCSHVIKTILEGHHIKWHRSLEGCDLPCAIPVKSSFAATEKCNSARIIEVRVDNLAFECEVSHEIERLFRVRIVEHIALAISGQYVATKLAVESVKESPSHHVLHGKR